MDGWESMASLPMAGISESVVDRFLESVDDNAGNGNEDGNDGFVEHGLPLKSNY